MKHSEDMKRFEKYFNNIGNVYIEDIPTTEILAVTDKKFIIDIAIYEKFKHSEFTHEYDDTDVLDEVYSLFRDKYSTLMDRLAREDEEFVNEDNETSEWLMYGKSNPLTANEVVKIKDEYKDTQYSIQIVDLVEL